MSVFVTGTDTGCGKTYVSCALLRALAALGYSVAGMKPVATGATLRAGAWRNDDVDALRGASTVALPERVCNPYLFEPPASPHLAAAAAGARIRSTTIVEAYRRCAAAADRVVVEGVGGWEVPLADDLDLPALARALELPVLLVVGIRLGCINHGLLTAAAIARAGVPFAGWIANLVEPELYARDGVVETLRARIPAPLLGMVDWCGESALVSAARRLVAETSRDGYPTG